ncbi:unnamed protein product [Miscanthus lutarioriparius]|uniref:AAA+ ATPase domain-containing protein n=1 Tax=Miscanthus lutarioriparius TaxID=422564 RepID=A0A811QSY6_9POAL|nr:unnamed protein product [Miscanthus lutarioriparius]
MEVAAVSAARWVLSKALGPVTDGLLEAWAASAGLGPNVETLKMELLYAQGMLENAQGREIRSPALKELLLKLQQLAYGADDVLDELDYFRIQDELGGTYHATDVHDGGCVHGLILNTRHTARAVARKLKLSSGSREASRGDPDPDEHEDGAKQGCFSVICSCGRRAIGSTPNSPNIQSDQNGGCISKVALSARRAAHTIGNGWPRFYCACSSRVQIQEGKRVVQIPKLNFDRVDISSKMKDIVEKLRPVSAKVSTILNMELLGSAILKLEQFGSNRTTTQNSAMGRLKTTPDIIEPKLYRRHNQKKIIIDGVKNEEYFSDGLVVLPIVGPGGIGKTTFTQHIFNEVKGHFEVPIWLCVSLNFNASRLAQEAVKIILEVDGENKKGSDQERIEQRLKAKRFLLVLDDMWTCHEDEWKKLLRSFRRGGEKGNMIIVTTRIPEVADMVKTIDCPIKMDRLEDKDFMDFFEACVFGHQKAWEDHPELRDVGEKIVSNLKGFPLAAKTVGRVLRNQLTLDHWTRVLESKEWELQTNENDIMPALKLSYDYLPFDLQRCFSYCSLFPEDYEFGMKVSSYECITILSSNVRSIQIPTSVRHLSIIIDDKEVENKENFDNFKTELRELDKRLNTENLRTLMLFGRHHGSFAMIFGHLFRNANALRAIYLSEASYIVEDVLNNFSKLVHLRYLRIKSKYMEDICLLSSLSRLYHLQVIDLQEWERCSGSVRDINNLVKLRHFLVPKDRLQLHSIIVEVGKLKLLQELRSFEVGKESKGFELSQLEQLSELGGSLAIGNLERTQTTKEASEAKLIHKNRLHKLTLEWDVNRPNKDPAHEANSLEVMKPHSNIRGICIRGHGGTNCPKWLGEDLFVKNLESLRLDDVSWKHFPPIGELWMVNEHALSFSHSTCCQQQKEANMKWFPRLRELKIKKCPKLLSFPPVPWTRAPCSAEIEGVGSGLEELVCKENYKSEYCLEIKMKGALVSELWNMLAFDNLNEVKELKMDTCPPLPLHHFQMLSSLKSLRLIGASSIVFPLVEGERHAEYQSPVECITISQWDASAKELTQLLTYFPNLSELNVWSGKKITWLAAVEKQATETPALVSSDNKVDDDVEIEQQEGTRGEEEIDASSAEGLLLLPSQLQKLLIYNCPELSLCSCSGPADYKYNKEAGRTSTGRGLQVRQAAGLQGLRNLKRLNIWSCAAIRSLPKDGLPISLQELVLANCPAIRSLPKDCLPSSLHELNIIDCPAIQSLPKDCLPSSLQKLVIRGCPAIRSLPKANDLPSPLRELDVRDSKNEELRRQCRKLIGIIPVVYA